MNEPEFLGTGWSFPPEFSRISASVVMHEGVACIRDSLRVLFATALGERIMLAEYGTLLRERLFTALTMTTANEILTHVADAILDWEPRIRVDGVDIVEIDPKCGILEISVDFTVRRTNVRSNFVYPFYLLEATIPQPSP